MKRGFLLRFEETVRRVCESAQTVPPQHRTLVPLAATQTVTKVAQEATDSDPKSHSLHAIPRSASSELITPLCATKTLTEGRESPDSDPTKRTLHTIPRRQHGHRSGGGPPAILVPLAATQTATSTRESGDADPKSASFHPIPRCY
jgi:hypothetical protein